MLYNISLDTSTTNIILYRGVSTLPLRELQFNNETKNSERC